MIFFFFVTEKNPVVLSCSLMMIMYVANRSHAKFHSRNEFGSGRKIDDIVHIFTVGVMFNEIVTDPDGY